MPGIAPTFTPGSGWLRDPRRWSSGTPEWVAQHQAASWPCAVMRMREFSMRLPPAAVKPPVLGHLLCIKPYGVPEDEEIYDAHLFRPAMDKELLQKLNSVVLIRENEGVRLYQGQEFHKETRRHFLQTWLCTPTVEAGLTILAKMAG